MEQPFACGTRVEKINSKADDKHRDGALARVSSVIGPTPPECEAPGVYGYFVRWDDLPEVPVFIAGTRIRAAETRGEGA